MTETCTNDGLSENTPDHTAPWLKPCAPADSRSSSQMAWYGIVGFNIPLDTFRSFRGRF